MSVAQRISVQAADRPVNRLEILQRTQARCARLQRLFDDGAVFDKIMRQGRYVRLCAAVAWASEREERAQAEYDTAATVAALRRARVQSPTARGDAG